MNNCETRFMTPGVSILMTDVSQGKPTRTVEGDMQLAFKILHDVEKIVVYVWLILELNLHRIEVAECIGDVQLTVRLGRLIGECLFLDVCNTWEPLRRWIWDLQGW